MAKIVLEVTGMKCGGCENQIQDAVKACPGVASVKASHKENNVEIEYDESAANLEAIRETIRGKGFAVT